MEVRVKECVRMSRRLQAAEHGRNRPTSSPKGHRHGELTEYTVRHEADNLGQHAATLVTIMAKQKIKASQPIIRNMAATVASFMNHHSDMSRHFRNYTSYLCMLGQSKTRQESAGTLSQETFPETRKYAHAKKTFSCRLGNFSHPQ